MKLDALGDEYFLKFFFDAFTHCKLCANCLRWFCHINVSRKIVWSNHEISDYYKRNHMMITL